MYLFERERDFKKSAFKKCGGEHYLKEEPQPYRINRLENNKWTVPTT